jgi:hypothetical protein
MRKTCAAKTRLELEWKDAAGVCGRLATSLVDNHNELSSDQSESLNKNLEIVRHLSEKLKKDLDSHLQGHGCAIRRYQQIAKLLDDVAAKHNLLAELFDTLPDPKYAERDEVSAQSERLMAAECLRLSASIRFRLKQRDKVFTPFRSFPPGGRIWFGLSFLPRLIRHFTHRVRCQ